MRRVFAVLIAVVAILGLLAPPVFAQAAAPAPKVTINGLVDFVTTVWRNATGESNASRDHTEGPAGRNNGWYSRERGVFTITGEVGRAKGVLALEFDFHNGKTVTNFDAAGFGGNQGQDLETDEKGQVEVKWLYLEVPVTGAGSLLPFIPVTSIGRFGAQPARGHDYKPGILFTGDFPGVAIETTWAPNLRSTLTYAQIEEALDPLDNPFQGGILGARNVRGDDDWAMLGSVEVDVFKGLTVKPTFAYVECRQGCSGNLGLSATTPGGNITDNLGTGNFARGGFNPLAATQLGRVNRRYNIGGDVKWTSGPFTLSPTVYYQWGSQECGDGGAAPGSNGACAKNKVDISSWIVDVLGGFRAGPLNVEARVMYTPGNKVDECVKTIVVGGTTVCSGGDKIKYYEPIMNGTSAFWAGWSELETAGVDYNMGMRTTSGTTLGRSPSYDKYGRIVLGGAMDYSLTPALTFHVVTNFQWTDQKVDNTATLFPGSGTGSLQPVKSKGDDRYLGNEWNLGFTYRFAPNVAFDLIGAYLFAGDARDHGRCGPGANDSATGVACAAAASSTTDRHSADDAYKVAARIRLTW